MVAGNIEGIHCTQHQRLLALTNINPVRRLVLSVVYKARIPIHGEHRMAQEVRGTVVDKVRTLLGV